MSKLKFKRLKHILLDGQTDPNTVSMGFQDTITKVSHLECNPLIGRRLGMLTTAKRNTQTWAAVQ